MALTLFSTTQRRAQEIEIEYFSIFERKMMLLRVSGGKPALNQEPRCSEYTAFTMHINLHGTP
jgi:hypothetical protein